MLASGGYDKTVRLWDVASQKPKGLPLTGHTDFVMSVSFSPDGKLLASGSNDKTVRLWDVANQSLTGESLTGHTDQVMSVSFSPDGKVLASGSDDYTVRLWDVASQSPKCEPLTGHTLGVKSVTFSPDGKMLASGGYDKTVRLWEVFTQQCLWLVDAEVNHIKSIAFNNDGRLLAFSCGNEIALLQYMPTATLPYRYCLVGYMGTTSLQAKQLNLHRAHGLTANHHRLLTQLGAKDNNQQELVVKPLVEGAEKPEPKKMIAPPLPPSVPKITSSSSSTTNPHTFFQPEKSSTPMEKVNPKDKQLHEETHRHESEQERKEKCLVM